VSLLDDPDYLALSEERARIQATHSWLHVCFPPRPTVCMVCGAKRSDPDLQPCTLTGLDATDGVGFPE